MPVESWIGIGGFVATTASAIAAFFSVVIAILAIRQSILQRTISTKPQIIISKQDITTEISSGPIFSLKTEDPNNYYQIPISVKNVGLGSALNIEYSWNFNFKKSLENCGFREVKDNPFFASTIPRTITQGKHYNLSRASDSGVSYYDLMNRGKLTHYAIKDKYSELEYIMPISQDSTQVHINFPTLILLLVSEQTQSTPTLDIMLDTLEAGQLHLKLQDISGNKIIIKFKCFMQMVKFKSVGENGPTATFRIEFQRIHSRSRLGLHRLRKSYAEFIEEHNYNKFK